jgi:uncharacterized Zn ribbon protein
VTLEEVMVEGKMICKKCNEDFQIYGDSETMICDECAEFFFFHQEKANRRDRHDIKK